MLGRTRARAVLPEGQPGIADADEARAGTRAAEYILGRADAVCHNDTERDSLLVPQSADRARQDRPCAIQRDLVRSRRRPARRGAIRISDRNAESRERLTGILSHADSRIELIGLYEFDRYSVIFSFARVYIAGIYKLILRGYM